MTSSTYLCVHPGLLKNPIKRARVRSLFGMKIESEKMDRNIGLLELILIFCFHKIFKVDHLVSLLRSAMHGRERVLLDLNVSQDNLEAVRPLTLQSNYFTTQTLSPKHSLPPHPLSSLLTLLSSFSPSLLLFSLSSPSSPQVLQCLPSLQAPTVSPLAGGGALAVRSAVPKKDANDIAMRVRKAGGSSILVTPAQQLFD